jgi:hypothetical protein
LIVKTSIIDAHRGRGGEGSRSKKLSHKNAIKHKNGEKEDPALPRFSDNSKDPPKNNLTKTLRTPPPTLWITNYCASMTSKSKSDVSGETVEAA